jgi:hypothetical protein
LRGHSILSSFSTGSQGFLFQVALGTTRGALEILFHKKRVSSRCGLLFEPHLAFEQLRCQSSSGRIDFGLQSTAKILAQKEKIYQLSFLQTAARQTQFGGGDVFTNFGQFLISAANSQAERVFDEGAFQRSTV